MGDRKPYSAVSLLAAVSFAAGSSAQVTYSDSLPQARNVDLVGHHDLQGRSSYHPIPHRYGDRMILFVGHGDLILMAAATPTGRGRAGC